jgi:hypothetical protein
MNEKKILIYEKKFTNKKNLLYFLSLYLILQKLFNEVKNII